jgi:hypothetical protein
MDNQDPNSPSRNRSPGTGETADSPNSERSGNKSSPSTMDWMRGERRLPENAKIRHWMNLGDKALQQAEEEKAEEDPIPEK